MVPTVLIGRSYTACKMNNACCVRLVSLYNPIV
nr:MAG TPA: hypothetical protein [Caudoviricetes sp.]